MNPRLLELIACPVCRTGLRVIEPSPIGEADAVLECESCSRRYPVVNGIPRLLPPELASASELGTGRRFTAEFTEFSEDDKDLDPFPLREYFFYSRAGIDPSVYEQVKGDPYRTSLDPDAYRPDHSFVAGKVVIDGGCGPARFTEVVARAGAGLVVGLELGAHVERAARRCAHLPNAAFVQGSILAPPFRDGVFDYAFTIGVVHHTPDPEGACRRLARLVADRGAMSVWVYPPEYWGGRVRGPVNRFVHRRLVSMEDERALWMTKKILYPFGRLQMKLARRKWTKFLFAPLFVLSVPRHPSREVMVATIYDYFAAKTISTHTYEEVEAWISDSGFLKLTRVPVPTAVLAERTG